MSEKTMVWFNPAGCEHERLVPGDGYKLPNGGDDYAMGSPYVPVVCQKVGCHRGVWLRVEPGYPVPPEGADVLVTIRRGGKRWVAAAKAMRRSETAMGFFAFPDPDRPGEWLRDVVAYQVFPLPLEDGEVAP